MDGTRSDRLGRRGSDVVGSLSAGERSVDAMLDQAHLAAPHELPELIARHAEALGARSAVAYLADLQQLLLVPFVGPAGPVGHAGHEQLEPLAIDATLAGRSYQQVDVLVQDVPVQDVPVQDVPLQDVPGSRCVVWLPLLDGAERLGVLRVSLDDPAALDEGGLLETRLRRLASLTAELVMTKTLYGDTIVRLRRRAEMGLAAEMQWSLLPPLTFACRQVVIAAALEPAYEVAGDSVDYAVDAGCARFAVFDGMGHGLQSAQLSVLATAAYRNGRRSGRSIASTARGIDGAVEESFGGEAFTTAVLGELDTNSGTLTWVNAGHPEPLLLRDGRLVKPLSAPPWLPFGLGKGLVADASYSMGTEHLQPGDRVLLYTDGIVEAQSPAGEQFGVPRLVDLLTRNLAGGLPTPETMRRIVRALLEHQQGRLRDDATLLLLEWRSGTEDRLLP